MQYRIFAGVLSTGVCLLLAGNWAQAQAPLVTIQARAEYRDPAYDVQEKTYPTVNEWAADGYQATVSARSLGNNDDSPENIARSMAYFSQSLGGVAVARGYGFGGANYSKYPVDIVAQTAIASQYTLRVVRDELDPLSPFSLKGYLPVHGLFSAFDFTHEVHSATASAFTGVRVQTTVYDEFGNPVAYDVTKGGTVTVRSNDYDYNPDNPAFEVEATGDLVNSVTLRTDLQDPEGYNWTTHGAELSQLLIFDLPLNLQLFTGGVNQDFTITFLQEINVSVKDARYKFAYADMRNTTGFEIVGVNPNTGERLDGAITVQLVGGDGASAAAPEPNSLFILISMGLVAQLAGSAHRRGKCYRGRRGLV